VEVIEETFIAGRFPFGPDALDGGVLLLETSEELLPARHVGWIVRALGERGILAAVAAVLVARPPVSSFTCRPRRPNAPGCAPSSATWSPGSSPATTLMPSCA
jgi:hypothetical protein